MPAISHPNRCLAFNARPIPMKAAGRSPESNGPRHVSRNAPLRPQHGRYRARPSRNSPMKTRISQTWHSNWKPHCVGQETSKLNGARHAHPALSQMDRIGAPPMAPESAPRASARSASSAKPQFNSLEDEMANLLGRPKNSS